MRALAQRPAASNSQVSVTHPVATVSEADDSINLGKPKITHQGNKLRGLKLHTYKLVSFSSHSILGNCYQNLHKQDQLTLIERIHFKRNMYTAFCASMVSPSDLKRHTETLIDT